MTDIELNQAKVEDQIAKMRVDENGESSDRELVSLAYRSEAIVEAFSDRWPTARELEEMSKTFGPELVQVALARILSRVTPNRYFYEQVESVLRDSPDLRPSSILWINKREPPVLSPKELTNRYELCIVSSVDPFQKGRQWGSHVGEWQHWARLSGMTTSVIETRKSQSLLSNAETIRRFLIENPHERRILATMGQGSTEFRLLLDQLSKLGTLSELEGLRAWVNVCGIVNGATGLNETLKSPWERRSNQLVQFMRGWPSQITQHLSASNPRLRLAPDWRGLNLVAVSLVGLPTVGDVAMGLKGRYLSLAKKSPNDGVCTFHDSIVRPGYVIPVPHLSHSAESMRLAPWMMATLRALKNSGDNRPFGLA